MQALQPMQASVSITMPQDGSPASDIRRRTRRVRLRRQFGRGGGTVFRTSRPCWSNSVCRRTSSAAAFQRLEVDHRAEPDDRRADAAADPAGAAIVRSPARAPPCPACRRPPAPGSGEPVRPGQTHQVAVGQRQAVGILGASQAALPQTCLVTRVRAFLQPGVAGMAAVEDVGEAGDERNEPSGTAAASGAAALGDRAKGRRCLRAACRR